MKEWQLHNLFVNALPGDHSWVNMPRQVQGACYSLVKPTPPKNPSLIARTDTLLVELGLSVADEQEFLQIFSGSKVMEGTQPYAMCYGGHQFGHWAGQLGDGRAINLFEASCQGKMHTFQLKGAGLTPYSRTADGLAVLRSSIREYICSEAMEALGVPTTRALSLILTGDEVWRDVMYDGHAAHEPGAIVCRVAPSFLRFGNYEILAARQDTDTLKKLVDFTIANYYPEISLDDKDVYKLFFKAVVHRTLRMVIDWIRVGFVHGVMNTDNMSILGLTIDYGPYGWLEPYDPDWTPNTTDAHGKRYAFGQQPNMAMWNLMKLANALYPLINDVNAIQEALDEYKNEYSPAFINMMCAKLGIQYKGKEDIALIQSLINCLLLIETDYTIFFRNLANFTEDTDMSLLPHFINEAFYQSLNESQLNSWLVWLTQYKARIKAEDKMARKVLMQNTNPKYVPRNYMLQLAIEHAEKGDYTMIYELQTLFKKPYDDQPGFEQWFAKRPEWARQKVGSSMLSCSS
jgi:serine/tyrosine/threonine adenylyltransferase